MSFVFGGTQANVTLNTAALQHTVSFLTATRTTTGTTTVGTVGAGKVWRILNCNLHQINDATTSTAVLNFNGVAAISNTQIGTATSYSNSDISKQWEYNNAPVLTAGQTITLVIDQNQRCGCNISYVEESA